LRACSIGGFCVAHVAANPEEVACLLVLGIEGGPVRWANGSLTGLLGTGAKYVQRAQHAQKRGLPCRTIECILEQPCGASTRCLSQGSSSPTWDRASASAAISSVGTTTRCVSFSGPVWLCCARYRANSDASAISTALCEGTMAACAAGRRSVHVRPSA
jgi:hypothetical protein